MSSSSLNKISKSIFIVKRDKITFQNIDTFFTFSLLIGCFSIRNEFYWQKKRVHENFYFNLSNLFAKSIIAIMTFVALIGFVLVVSRTALFFIRANRVARLKKKFDHFFKDQVHDSKLNTFIFFAMGGLMSVFSVRYLVFSVSVATGFGAVVGCVSRVLLNNPTNEIQVQG